MIKNNTKKSYEFSNVVQLEVQNGFRLVLTSFSLFEFKSHFWAILSIFLTADRNKNFFVKFGKFFFKTLKCLDQLNEAYFKFSSVFVLFQGFGNL